MKRLLSSFFLVSGLMVASSPAPIIPNCADCDVANRSMMSGATFVKSGASATAYIITQIEGALPEEAGTDPAFTVYRKDGLPSAAGSYAPVGVMRAAVDPATVAALLQRAWSLRPDLTPSAQESGLSAKLDQMFGSLASSAAGQPVATKLANVIAAGMSDPEYRDNLALLGKTFPGVNLCLGNAWAGPVSAAGPSTFEIRLRHPTSGEDLAVVGRVIVDASLSPAALPAPGSPVNAGVDVEPPTLPATLFADFRALPGNNAKAVSGFNALSSQLQGQRVNRAVRLRWATPDPLRQRSILQNGYNVYRLPAGSVPPGWVGGATGPTFTDLMAASPVKVNTLPVFNLEDLDAAMAADPSNTETFFFADHVGPLQELRPDTAVLPGGGAAFVYFVTAVDVLGRDGAVSPGTKVAIYNRIPPKVVRGLEVVNDYAWSAGSGKQRLKLSWDPVPTTPETGTLEYEIFRWNSYDGARRAVGATPVAKVTSATTAFLDAIAGSPSESDAGKTWWYTVRAVRTVSVSGFGTQKFYSGHSAPVYGVIRDREGPGVISGRLDVPCKRPSVTAQRPLTNKGSSTEVGRRIPLTLRCERLKADIVWAEFFYQRSATSGASTAVLARVYFGNNNLAEHTLTYDAASFGQAAASIGLIHCRVGTDNGAISASAAADTTGLGGDQGGVLEGVIPFVADVVTEMVPSTEPCPQGGDPGLVDKGSGKITNPGGAVEVPPLTREVNFYRRVDQGPMAFIYHATLAESMSIESVPWSDPGPLPLNGGRVCYYAQAYDRDGNAGPYLRLDCVDFPSLVTPVPHLDRITPNPASGGSRTLRVAWFCPPVGVDRFYVYISKDGQMPAASLGVDLLRDNSAAGDGETLAGEGAKKFGRYESSRVEGAFSGEANSPVAPEPPMEFSIDLPADEGSSYTVAVRAVSASSTVSELSNVRSGQWIEETAVTTSVPWPARPLPAKLEPLLYHLGPSEPASVLSFAASTAVDAKVLTIADTGDFDGVGVSIGRLTSVSRPQTDGQGGTSTFASERFDPNKGIYRVTVDDTDGAALFPCALYRYRVANAADAGVKNDMVQVTPLMESVAYGYVDAHGNANAAGLNTRLYDPFIRFSYGGQSSGKTVMNMFLTDTLPVVSGSTYRYVLVRFDKDSKEPKDIIPVTNPVTVP